jgi:hypothetical protein
MITPAAPLWPGRWRGAQGFARSLPAASYSC